MDIDPEPWLNGLNYKVALGRKGGRGAETEIEVGTREKTKAVMLRKEGLSWRAHPRTNTASPYGTATPHRQREKSSLESHQDLGGLGAGDRERESSKLPSSMDTLYSQHCRKRAEKTMRDTSHPTRPRLRHKQLTRTLRHNRADKTITHRNTFLQ